MYSTDMYGTSESIANPLPGKTTFSTTDIFASMALQWRQGERVDDEELNLGKNVRSLRKGRQGVMRA